ncbi:DNA-binding response regulator, partial [Klebsiella pneumoniae]|nr:DNA-binding response regulator [Klebsiella pneumoniae]
DDYVVKPFNPVEVVARAHAILRRSGGSGQGGVIRLGPLEIDLEAHIVQWCGRDKPQRLPLTLTEFRMLA